MTDKSKSNAALYWVIAVLVVSMGFFVYLFTSDAPKTLSKIKLSYFVDEQEIVDSVGKRLFQELNAAPYVWIGIEPGKNEQLVIVQKMKSLIESKGVLSAVIVDSELALTDEMKQSLGATDALFVKDDWAKVGQKLSEFEKNNQRYILVTASIYSTSLLHHNPIYKMKEKFGLKPMTFSFGYLSLNLNDEGNSMFKCNTEDATGVKEWACFATNKSRAARRRYDESNQKPWVGLMDLTGETDYALLIQKKL